MSQSFIRHKFVHSKIGSENISTLKDRSFDVVFQHCTVKTKYIFKNIVAMKKIVVLISTKLQKNLEFEKF